MTRALVHPLVRLAMCLTVVCAVAAPALAQTSRPRTSSKRQKIVVAAFANVDSNAMSASKTFKALFGSSRETAFGGGADIQNIFGHAFVRFDASAVTVNGTRAIVSGGQVFSLGIPMTVKMRPFEIGGGWRFSSRTRPRVTPYVGLAAVVLSYHETSSFSVPSDTVSTTYSGTALFGGVDVGVTKLIFAGLEVEYRGIPNAIAVNSTSLAGLYNETNLGGVGVRFRFGITF